MNIQATAPRDFEIQSTTDAVLHNSTQNADGSFTKTYQLFMPDNNTFVHFRVEHPQMYTMQYQYFDPIRQEIVLLEIQQVPQDSLPSSVTPPAIDGYSFVRWQLEDGTIYDFNTQYSTDQVITAFYEQKITPPQRRCQLFVGIMTVSTFCWDYFQVALTSTANLQEHHANAI